MIDSWVVSNNENNTLTKNPSLRNFWLISTDEIEDINAEVYIEMSAFFNASHQVVFEKGTLGKVHQHSFHLMVKALSTQINGNEIITPFENLKMVLSKVAMVYEGKFLNDLPPFDHIQPSTENLTALIARQIMKLSIGLPILIAEVALFESPTVGIRIEFGKQKRNDDK